MNLNQDDIDYVNSFFSENDDDEESQIDIDNDFNNKPLRKPSKRKNIIYVSSESESYQSYKVCSYYI